MAIFHGSVRRPAALQRSDSPVAKPAKPTAEAGVAPVAKGMNPSAALPAPVVAESETTKTVVTKKRTKSGRPGRQPVASERVAPSTPSSSAAPVASLGPLPQAASETVEHLLQLPRGELAKLLAESGESANKVWLALIYRLSALESQVTELASALRSNGASAAKAAVSAVRAGAGEGKTDLLEQVFRKNLSLRKSGGL